MRRIKCRGALKFPLLAAVLQRCRGKSTIGEKERQKRAEDFRQAEASVRLSGLALSPEARCLFERYAAGELSLSQVGSALNAFHRRQFDSLSQRDSAGSILR